MCRSSSTKLREFLSRLDIITAHPAPHNNPTTPPQFHEQPADPPPAAGTSTKTFQACKARVWPDLFTTWIACPPHPTPDDFRRPALQSMCAPGLNPTSRFLLHHPHVPFQSLANTPRSRQNFARFSQPAHRLSLRERISRHHSEFTGRGFGMADRLSGRCESSHHFPPSPAHRRYRSSVISPIPAAPHFRSHWTNSERYAVTRMCSRNRAHFRILFSDAYARVPLTVRRCASGAYGRTPKEIYRRSRRHVSHRTFFRSRALTDPTDVPPGDRGLETPDTSEHPAPPRCYYQSTPTDILSDARWDPRRVRRESPRHGQDESCKRPFCFIVQNAYSFVSCLASQKVSITCNYTI